MLYGSFSGFNGCSEVTDRRDSSLWCWVSRRMFEEDIWEGEEFRLSEGTARLMYNKQPYRLELLCNK